MKPNKLDCLRQSGCLCNPKYCSTCPYWQELDEESNLGQGRKIVGSSGNVRVIEIGDGSYTIEFTRNNLVVDHLRDLSIEDIHTLLYELNDAIQ